VGSFFVQQELYSWRLAILGAILGFVVFYFFFWLANLLYGDDRIALGMGDVKLAMMLGMMLGFPSIFYCLLWGIVLGGVITLILLLTRRVNRGTALPYGQYLALSGIAFLIWGADYVQQYIR
jgi:prepilin signal peptidase PulO-like enzyme (type II secretory pathway)